MARVTKFFRASAKAVAHPTDVECGWQVVSGDELLLQLSSYGSDHRLSHKKVSQTLQLDRERARELARIVRLVFPDEEA